jgi:hypothetical protein
LFQFVASISRETSKSCCKPNGESQVFGKAHLAGIGRAGGLDRRCLRLKTAGAPHLPASFMWSPVRNLTQLCTETASPEIAQEWGKERNRLAGTFRLIRSEFQPITCLSVGYRTLSARISFVNFFQPGCRIRSSVRRKQITTISIPPKSKAMSPMLNRPTLGLPITASAFATSHRATSGSQDALWTAFRSPASTRHWCPLLAHSSPVHKALAERRFEPREIGLHAARATRLRKTHKARLLGVPSRPTDVSL